MKKGLPLLLILAFVLPQYSQAQGLVKRKRVLMEVMTGTWCVFCPGSAMGADDMVQNGHDIAIVKHHVGDSYQNAASLSRETLYNVNSYPTTIFNGDDFYSGGSTNNSLYNAYFGRYQANQDSTPIDMTMRVVRDGNQMKVQVDVTQVGTYTGNLVLHVSLTESHIPDSWFGQTEVNFASRGMYPTFSGTSLNLMEGVTQSYEIIAPVNSSWVVENMEAVVWIQDITTNEVMNADRVKLLFPDQIYEVKADAITSNTPAYQCASDQNEFTISVLNTDADTVTSMDITYQLNEELASIYNWTGVLPYEESVDITLPIV
ncbi:MAG: Omp28-related outer membrane protein, partial [Bacteroidota bacterium]